MSHSHHSTAVLLAARTKVLCTVVTASLSKLLASDPSLKATASSLASTFERMAQEPHICLILAGGTICMQPSPDGYIPTQGQLLSRCLATSATFNDVLAPRVSTIPYIVDELGTRRPADASFALPRSSLSEPAIRYTAFEFHDLIDSSSADAYYWNILASCVVANYHSFDGFVILHGTDTLSYAASALSFLLHPLNKPVIFTGSQVSIFDQPNDAWRNILGALCCAARLETRQHEVGVFFHGALYRGNRSTKIHASDYAAFASPNMPEPLARLEDGKRNPIVCNPSASWAAVATHPFKAPLEPLVTLRALEVAVFRVYPGLTSSVLSALIDSMPMLRGLVLETFGAGHMPSNLDFRQVIKTAIEQRGIVIVNVSQCVSGAVAAHYAPAKALEKLGVVYGQDMTTEAAFTKLMWILSQPKVPSTAEIEALMTQSLRGELSESTGGIFRPRANVREEIPLKSRSVEIKHLDMFRRDIRLPTLRPIPLRIVIGHSKLGEL